MRSLGSVVIGGFVTLFGAALGLAVTSAVSVALTTFIFYHLLLSPKPGVEITDQWLCERDETEGLSACAVQSFGHGHSRFKMFYVDCTDDQRIDEWLAEDEFDRRSSFQVAAE